MTRHASKTPPSAPQGERRVLTEQELADRWGISIKTLQRWRCTALGPRFLKLGNRVGYRLEDIEQYERRVCRDSTSERAFA